MSESKNCDDPVICSSSGYKKYEVLRLWYGFMRDLGLKPMRVMPGGYKFFIRFISSFVILIFSPPRG